MEKIMDLLDQTPSTSSNSKPSKSPEVETKWRFRRLPKWKSRATWIDGVTAISNAEFKDQLLNSDDIKRNEKFTPKTKRAMERHYFVDCENFFCTPGRKIPNCRLDKMFSTTLNRLLTTLQTRSVKSQEQMDLEIVELDDDLRTPQTKNVPEMMQDIPKEKLEPFIPIVKKTQFANPRSYVRKTPKKPVEIKLFTPPVPPVVQETPKKKKHKGINLTEESIPKSEPEPIPVDPLLIPTTSKPIKSYGKKNNLSSTTTVNTVKIVNSATESPNIISGLISPSKLMITESETDCHPYLNIAGQEIVISSDPTPLKPHIEVDKMDTSHIELTTEMICKASEDNDNLIFMSESGERFHLLRSNTGELAFVAESAMQ